MQKILSIIGLSVGLAWAGNAAEFILDSSSATIVSGNNVPSLFDATPPSTYTGTEKLVYTATFGTLPGSFPAGGFYVDITFNGPQPFLTEAILKAGDQYLEWGSAALTAFNSGTWTSIELRNDDAPTYGIENGPGNAYLGTSHAGLDGRPGVGQVPDSGTTLALLGVSLCAIQGLRRKLAAA